MSEPALIETGDLIEPLRRMGLLKAGEPARLTPLTGGVSSDISLVEAGGRRFCVKRALPRLKVAALWEAPVERNAAEAAYMRAVAALAAACRSARARRRRESGLVRDGLSCARGPSLMEGAASRRNRRAWISPPRSGAILASSMRAAPPIRTFRPPSPTIPRSRRSASSLTCARRAARTLSLPRASMSSRRRRSRRSGRWFTATSARRTSCKARPDRCSSTPNAPGSAIPPSISPSVSIISCSRARARARIGRATMPPSPLWLAPISPASTGRRRGQARSARRRAAAGSVPRPHRRQVAGRVPHPRE